MKVLGLLTGRGNNTLKDKNIKEICGHPVLFYPAMAAKKSGMFDYLYCSSDDSKILKEAEKCGFKSIVRPKEISTPNSQHIDCIYHALDYLKEKENIIPDIIVVILANNVTIKDEWIKDCIKIMKNSVECSAVVPVVEENDHHPLRAKIINSNGNLVSYKIEGLNANSTNRQDLPTNYFLAHNFWVLSVKSLLNKEIGDGPWKFMGKNVKPYVIPKSIDIHHEEDLIEAEKWIKDNS